MQVVAEMYATGEGTKLDRSEALLWFVESGRRGNKEAMASAQKVRSAMTEKEWKDAQKKLLQRNLDPQWVEKVLQPGSSPPMP